MNARAIRAAHAATVAAEFSRDDVPGLGDKEVTFTAVSKSIAVDDIRKRAYVEDYELEDVKIDGVGANLDEALIIENRVKADGRGIDADINEKLDELANGFGV